MGEILINKTTRGLQHQPAITQVSDSLFCAVWRDADEVAIRGRIIKVDGANGGEEFTVNATDGAAPNTDRTSPAITLSGGGLAVAWIEKAFNPPGPRPHVKLQRFDLSGRKVGTAIQVSTTEGFHQNPRTKRLVDGNYVIAWRKDPSSVGGGALTFRIFDLEGVPRTGEIRPNISGFRGEKAMTLLDDGRFIIAHVSTATPSDIGVMRNNVKASVFEADGRPSNISMLASNENGVNCSFSALAPLPGGRFLLSWVQKSAETFSTVPNVKAKIFSAREASGGHEIQANTSTGGTRFNVCAATAFADGQESAFIAWADDSATGGDTSNTAIRGRGFRIVDKDMVAAE